MTKERNIGKTNQGDEAPGAKDFLIVISVFLILVILSWISYFKFGWLH